MKFLPIKRISSPNQRGDVHVVQWIGISSVYGPVVCIDGAQWQLPEDLRPWVMSTIAQPEIGFPCEVEFSVLKGRTCADFVV